MIMPEIYFEKIKEYQNKEKELSLLDASTFKNENKEKRKLWKAFKKALYESSLLDKIVKVRELSLILALLEDKSPQKEIAKSALKEYQKSINQNFKNFILDERGMGIFNYSDKEERFIKGRYFHEAYQDILSDFGRLFLALDLKVNESINIEFSGLHVEVKKHPTVPMDYIVKALNCSRINARDHMRIIEVNFQHFHSFYEGVLIDHFCERTVIEHFIPIKSQILERASQDISSQSFVGIKELEFNDFSLSLEKKKRAKIKNIKEIKQTLKDEKKIIQKILKNIYLDNEKREGDKKPKISLRGIKKENGLIYNSENKIIWSDDFNQLFLIFGNHEL